MVTRFFRRNYKVGAIAILFILALIVYSNTFSNSFHFDDAPCITDNPAIRDLANLRNIWNFGPTRFVTYISIAFNYKIGGLDVFGYHLFNFLVHAGTGMLVWWLVMLTFATPLVKKESIATHALPVAFFAGAIFLVHPLQTQPVNYIIQRASLLATLFYIASLCLYVQARIGQDELRGACRRKVYYACSLAMAVLGMLSKEIAITLPLAVCLYEFFFLRAKKDFPWKYVIPFFIITLGIALVAQHSYALDLKSLGWVAREGPRVSAFSYFLTQFKVEVTYLRLLFAPFNQNLDYDYPMVRSIFEMRIFFSFLVLLLVVMAGIRLFNKYRLASFGIFWFFITLLPESSVIPIRDAIFEHRLYLPMAGFSLFLASGLLYVCKDKRAKRAVVLLCMLVACYSVMAYQRNKVWKNDLTLWDDVVHKSPLKARAYNNRGMAYRGKGDFDHAIADYDKAIGIDPHLVGVYSNRGMAYRDKGDFGQAFSDYNKEIVADPQLAGVYNNRGIAYRDKGNLEQAIADFNKTIEMNPLYADANNNRGNVYRQKGDLDHAFSDYNKAIEINPALAEAYNNRGNAYQDKGDLDQAISDYNKAIKLDSRYARAYNNRGSVYQKKGDFGQAISDFSKALGIDPRFADAYYNRGNAYQNNGNFGQAISDYDKAVDINPRFVNAYYNRAVAYFEQQEYAKSWEDVHKVESLGDKTDPDFLAGLKRASGKDK